MNAQRRSLLLRMAALGCASHLPACRHVPDPHDLCALDARPADPESLLLIDTHAHVFNGSDLQIREFVARVAAGGLQEWRPLVEQLGGILQLIGWGLAPSASAEMRQLEALKPLLAACDKPQLSEAIRGMRVDSYKVARGELTTAKTRRREAAARPPESAAPQRNVAVSPQTEEDIDQLPADYERYAQLRNRRATPEPGGIRLEQKTPSSILDFVIQHFNYRLVNVLDYLEKYRLPSGPVDLLVSSLVDFDFWLSRGKPTATPISEQIRVMEQISVVTRGRVHGFVPFCPFREATTSTGGLDGDAMRWVRDAVTQRGFIGVKMYPPMGFAPYGNAELGRAGLWAGKDWLPPLARRQDFGELLDGALDRLYGWCTANEVPIMAHTSLSNYADDAFKLLPGSTYWAKALAKWPKLQVNFGHFGDSSPVPDESSSAKGFVKLMSLDETAPGIRAYADSGYFFDAVDRDEALKALLGRFLRSSIADGRGLVRDRFMYGSDWLMTVSEYRWGEYLTRFAKIIAELSKDIGASDPKWLAFERQFFGLNAARYLGLGRPLPGRENNRSRLQAFYARNAMTTPDWIRKVDQQLH
jgi:hypothetical protein